MPWRKGVTDSSKWNAWYDSEITCKAWKTGNTQKKNYSYNLLSNGSDCIVTTETACSVEIKRWQVKMAHSDWQNEWNKWHRKCITQ